MNYAENHPLFKELAGILVQRGWAEDPRDNRITTFLHDVLPLLAKRKLSDEQMKDFIRLYDEAISPPPPPPKLGLADSLPDESDIVDEHKLATVELQRQADYVFLPHGGADLETFGHRLNVASLLANLSDEDMGNLGTEESRKEIIDTLRPKYKGGHDVKPASEPLPMTIGPVDPDGDAVLAVISRGKAETPWSSRAIRETGSGMGVGTP